MLSLLQKPNRIHDMTAFVCSSPQSKSDIQRYHVHLRPPLSPPSSIQTQRTEQSASWYPSSQEETTRGKINDHSSSPETQNVTTTTICSGSLSPSKHRNCPSSLYVVRRPKPHHYRIVIAGPSSPHSYKYHTLLALLSIRLFHMSQEN
jgi:hypothetical protein